MVWTWLLLVIHFDVLLKIVQVYYAHKCIVLVVFFCIHFLYMFHCLIFLFCFFYFIDRLTFWFVFFFFFEFNLWLELKRYIVVNFWRFMFLLFFKMLIVCCWSLIWIWLLSFDLFCFFLCVSFTFLFCFVFIIAVQSQRIKGTVFCLNLFFCFCWKVNLNW